VHTYTYTVYWVYGSAILLQYTGSYADSVI